MRAAWVVRVNMSCGSERMLEHAHVLAQLDQNACCSGDLP